MKTVYQEHGFKNRQEYLSDLADEFGLTYETVETMANIYGPAEDFDGLVSSVRDLADEIYG